MKDYLRKDARFALCGLNCGLCPMFHSPNACPGCGGGVGHQPCMIVRCAMQHGNIEYCFECSEFPCDKYAVAMEYDSFLPKKNMVNDLKKAQTMGIDKYLDELSHKIKILNELLKCYNTGRKKTFYCVSINLLDLSDLQEIMETLNEKENQVLNDKEKETLAVNLFESKATEKNISLKLNKKKK